MFLQSHTLFPLLCATRKQWPSPPTFTAHNRSLLERNSWRVVQNNHKRQNNHKSRSFDRHVQRCTPVLAHTHKNFLNLRHFGEVPSATTGLIHGEQTRCGRKQDALRRAAVDTHLAPIPGLTLSFPATIILMDLDTQKILGKEHEGKYNVTIGKKKAFFKIISLFSRN